MIFETCALILLFGYIMKCLLTSQHSAKNLPPGPWGLPIFGHLPLLGMLPHLKLVEWGKMYGPIIFIRFGSFPTVVLNDVKVIKEAFSRASFSGRGQIKHLVEGMPLGIVMTEGVQNTEQRQFTLRMLKDFGFGRKAVEELIQEEIRQLVDSIGQKSGQMVQVKRMFSAYVLNAVWIIVMGQRFRHDDPQVSHFSEMVTTKVAGADTILAKMSMFLPFLGTWLPQLSGYNERVEALKVLTDYMNERIRDRKLSWVKDQPRDYTDAYLDKVDETTDVDSSFHVSRNTLPENLRDLFMASLETTNSSLEWLMNFMARSPQVQIKLQEEIDRVVGQSRSPNLSDRLQMPYAESVMLEVLRISSIFPLSVFHRSLEDIEFYDYKIPKGTMVIANLYASLHDEDVWGDPENFRPERFIGDDGKLKKFDNFVPFGTGKRACIGEVMGRDTLFLYTTSIFQKFTISMPPEVPDLVPTFGVVLGTPAFQVQFDERQIF